MQVLVSVTSVQEAQWALAAGVQLIDLKETSYGALAALDIAMSASIVAAVKAHRQQFPDTEIVISATIGDECPSSAEVLSQQIATRLALGVDVIKLPETVWSNPLCQQEIQTFIARPARLIAVLSPALLLDQKILCQRLQQLAESGYWGVMVDTIEKSKPLTTLVDQALLDFFVTSAKAHNLYVGLAGGLRLEQLEALQAICPDYVGFRSGLCLDQQRAQALIPEKMNLLFSKLSEFC